MSSSSFSLRFLLRSLPASSSTECCVSTEGLGSGSEIMLLRPRRHLLARRDKGAMLALAIVTVADLTPAMMPIDEVAESDLACEARCCSGVSSKSSKHHRSLRVITGGTVCCLFLRRRVLTQRWKGLVGRSLSESSSPIRFVCSSLLCITLWYEAALPGLSGDCENMVLRTPEGRTGLPRTVNRARSSLCLHAPCNAASAWVRPRGSAGRHKFIILRYRVPSQVSIYQSTTCWLRLHVAEASPAVQYSTSSVMYVRDMVTCIRVSK